MKASELRMFNIVLNEEGLRVKVTSSMLNLFATGQIKLFPIPITEEWLIKAGFVYDDEFEGLVLQLESGISFGFGLNEGDSIIYYMGNLEPYWVDILNEIKHIHQLQNLFYILSGEELTIKE